MLRNFLTGVKINGYPCKDTTSVSENDFFFNGLIKPGSTNNSKGYIVTGANVEKIPGLNTLGVSMSRIDYAPGGVNPPHTHLRASEIVFVLQGQLQVGFITSANKLISKTINAGEVFVFPKGLVHFQKNIGRGPASVISAFNSQLPGTQSIGSALFAATPPVPNDILSKSLHINERVVEKIKFRSAPKL